MVKIFKETQAASVIPRNTESDKQPRQVRRSSRNDSIGLRIILDQSPQLRVNPIGIPEIQLPLQKTKDNPDTCTPKVGYWHVKCDRVHDEIAALVNELQGIVLQEREIKRIQNILSGRAWKLSGATAESELILDFNPLVEGIYIFLHQRTQQGQFEGTCTKLLTDLRILGRKKGVDILSEQWPKGAAQLSRKLDEQKENLETVGIHFVRGRRSGGERYASLCTSKKSLLDRDFVDDADDPASQAPSNDDPKNSESDSPFDAGDGVLTEELASINISSKGEK